MKLILVDDHDQARNALARRLGLDGRLRVVGQTACLQEALRFAEEYLPHVALVDTRREDGTGIEVVSVLASLPQDRRPLVVVHTAFFDAGDWRRSRAAGAREWLIKQFDVDLLFERLRAAVERELPRWRWAGDG